VEIFSLGTIVISVFKEFGRGRFFDPGLIINSVDIISLSPAIMIFFGRRSLLGVDFAISRTMD
jgi:hypothetical protein